MKKLSCTLLLLSSTLSLFAADPCGMTGVISDARPNILFITLDDMNWDSIGTYGCPVPDISPNIDALAEQGLRFENAFVQTTTCAPSRNVFQTGRYPHSSGIQGFYNVEPDFKILSELLSQEGYFTGVINKPRDTSPNGRYDQFWDSHVILLNDVKRTPSNYKRHMDAFLQAADKSRRPFYCVVNIADPHKPFFRDPKAEQPGFDKTPPSRVYAADNAAIPPFLPEHDEIRQEMANYYSSVKRGDDCVGAVMESLQASALHTNTIMVLISDHGMPLPYAKSSMYPDGIRTPWIMVWPSEVEPGSINDEHFVSAIDFAPTILDIVGAEIPAGMQGRSIMPILCGEKELDRDYVFTEFNETAGGVAQPMRAIMTKKWLYIFNPWATGDHAFISAANWYQSYGVMKRLSQHDQQVASRFDYLNYRAVEELYDVEKDPHALENVMADPRFAKEADRLRHKLEEWMRSTDDYCLEAFLVRGDVSKLKAFMKQVDAEALHRAETLQWKRWNNRAGSTGDHTLLYRSGSKGGHD